MFEVICNEAYIRRMLLEAMNKLLWSILAIVEFILGLRFLSTLMSSSSGTGFFGVLVHASRIVLAPFETILGVGAVAGSALQLTSLFAIAAYLVVFWMILNMNGFMLARTPLSYQKISRATATVSTFDDLVNLDNPDNLELVWSVDEEIAA